MSVKRWLRAKASPHITALIPVRVRESVAAEARSRAVVTTPRGLRLEGLELDAICTLVARLG